MRNYFANLKLSKLEVLIAINGGTVLVLEIIGTRLMAPFFGTSIYVWTAIIGVILLALSVGYWYGGKLADKGASTSKLAMMFMLIALILAVSLSAQPSILSFLSESGLSIRLSAFLAALSVYALPATLMGFVSPYISKLCIKNLKHSGETIGRLYAAGTFGSIVGTFLSGYWLTGYFTNESINWAIVILYVALAIITNKNIVKDTIFQIQVLCIILLLLLANSSSLPDNIVYQKDTPYARYQVVDTQYRSKPSRLLLTDKFGSQSGIYLNEPGEPAFQYIETFVKIAREFDNPERVLVVGGGAYTLPQYLAEMYPEAYIDVVEIDGELEKISIDYFNYIPTDKITNIVEDGRIFLNENEQKYDMIFLDAFASNQPPFQLSTQESFQAVQKSLSKNGIVALNTIGSQSGERSQFIASIDRTFRNVFDIAKTQHYKGRIPDDIQNILLVGSNGADIEKYLSVLDVNDVSLASEGVLLTDSFAPTERLLFN